MGLIRFITHSVLYTTISLLELFTKKQKIETRTPEKILILGYSGLGNLIMGTPILKPLRNNLPKATIDVLVTSNGQKALLENNKNIDNILVLKRNKTLLGRLSEIKKLRYKYDTVFCLYPAGFLGALSGKILRAKQVIGHPFHKGFGKTSTLYYTHTIELEKEHDVFSNINMLKPFGIKVENPEYDVPLSKQQLNYGRDYMKKIKNPIGFHPGSNPDQKWKRMSIQKYVELAKLLQKKEYTPIFFLGPDEKELVPILEENNLKYASPGIIETAAIIKNCKKFISNDSGLMHLAISQGIETYGILGPTQPWRTGPFKNNVIHIPLWCSPCYTPNKPFTCVNKEYLKCMKDLNVEQIAKEILS